MKSTEHKKGDLVTAYKFQPAVIATRDYADVRGEKEIIEWWAQKHGYTEIDIRQVTGTHAPVNEWYGIVKK